MKHHAHTTNAAKTPPSRRQFPEDNRVTGIRSTVTGCAVGSAPPPDSEIQSLMNSQESGLIQLHDAISRLRERLGPVLIPSPCAESGGVSTPTGSDLGRGLNTHNGRIYDSVASINTIINELAI